MLEIFKFYIRIVVQIFNRVLQSITVADGLTYGTFLLGCGLFVVFINLLKFQLGTNGLQEIKSYRAKQELANAKHVARGKHESGYNGSDNHSYIGKHSSRSVNNRRLGR